MSGREAYGARAFGRAAGAYVRARPAYPPEALAWLAPRLGLEAGRTVIDLGAGTGIFSAALAATGAETIAVEPSEKMRATLAGLPGVRAVAGSAEALPLPDASADAACAAQSFHWFDAPRALDELARVLRPDGRLGLVWNLFDVADPLTGALDELVWRHRDPDGPIAHLTTALHPQGTWQAALDADARASHVATRRFPNAQELDREGLADRVRSISAIAALPDTSREAAAAEAAALVEPGVPAVLRYVCEVAVYSLS